MRAVLYSSRFLKDFKLVKKRNLRVEKLKELVEALATDSPLPKSARPHKLSGNYVGMWDAHIAPDWILIYEIDDTALVLRRTGTHADLFG